MPHVGGSRPEQKHRIIRRRPTRIVGLRGGLACLVMVAGCSTPLQTNNPNPAQTVDTTGAQRPVGSREEERAALQSLLEATDLAPGEREAVIDEYQRQIQEAIANCMDQEGFEYIPIALPAGPLTDTVPDLSEEQFLARYGFGISTRLGVASAASSAIHDPNAEFMNEMSPAEAEAWSRSMASCYSVATENVEKPAIVAVQDNEALAGLSSKIEARVDADPRVVASYATWSTCMADLGYSFESPSDPIVEVSQRADPYVSRYRSAQEDAFERSGDPQGIPLDEVFSPVELAELRKLQDFELAVASDSVDCAVTSGIEVTRTRVREELMSEYMDEVGR